MTGLVAPDDLEDPASYAGVCRPGLVELVVSVREGPAKWGAMAISMAAKPSGWASCPASTRIGFLA